jgi:hypothetical protein
MLGSGWTCETTSYSRVRARLGRHGPATQAVRDLAAAPGAAGDLTAGLPGRRRPAPRHPDAHHSATICRARNQRRWRSMPPTSAWRMTSAPTSATASEIDPDAGRAPSPVTAR